MDEELKKQIEDKAKDKMMDEISKGQIEDEISKDQISDEINKSQIGDEINKSQIPGNNVIKGSEIGGENDSNKIDVSRPRVENQNQLNEDKNKPKEVSQDYIRQSSLARKKKQDQRDRNRAKNVFQKANLPVKRQMNSFMANKDIAIRDAVRENREKNKQGEVGSEPGNRSSTENQNESRLKSSKKALKAGSGNSKFKLKGAKGSGSYGKMRMATDRILQSAWRLAVPSWSLSLFYVYVHTLLSLQFSKKFSPLGHEWVPTNIKRTNEELAKKIGNKIGMAEKPLAGACCAVHLFLIIIILVLIYIITNPIDFGLEVIREIWCKTMKLWCKDS